MGSWGSRPGNLFPEPHHQSPDLRSGLVGMAPSHFSLLCSSENYISQAPLLSDSWVSSVSGRQWCSCAGKKLEYFSFFLPLLLPCGNVPPSEVPVPTNLHQVALAPGFRDTIPSSSPGSAGGFLLLLIQVSTSLSLLEVSTQPPPTNPRHWIKSSL